MRQSANYIELYYTCSKIKFCPSFGVPLTACVSTLVQLLLIGVAINLAPCLTSLHRTPIAAASRGRAVAAALENRA